MKKVFDNPFFMYLIIAILAFVIILVSVSSVSIQQMGNGDFFVESILPIPYWIGIAIITCVAFFAIRYLSDKRSILISVFISLILLVSFRIAFPVMFTSIPAYEPDAINYMNIVNSWVKGGVDFGFPGYYQHDYPLSFLTAFTFVKFGVPVDTFFRVAPFVIYAIDLLMLYLIVAELIPGKKKIAATSAFLFSFSSLGYWVTVHYSPDLFGTMFYFVSLFLSVKFAIKGNWSFKTLAPVCVSIVLLVLAHHLSTLYFIVTMLGLALSTWFFNPPAFKGKALSFVILGIFTYTFWFAYGSLVYPNFFNVYSYFSGSYGSASGLVQQASLFVNFTFLVYPAFIIALFLIEFLRVFHVKNIRDILSVRKKLAEARIRESGNTAFVFSMGFILVLGLFFIGFAVPVSFPTRVLEVLCIGFYPLSSLAFIRLSEGSISKKKLIVILIILLIVVLIGVHRYDSQIQRRVISG